eukprot:5931214-Prorocentrum_lima.AAC.1
MCLAVCIFCALECCGSHGWLFHGHDMCAAAGSRPSFTVLRVAPLAKQKKKENLSESPPPRIKTITVRACA